MGRARKPPVRACTRSGLPWISATPDGPWIVGQHVDGDRRPRPQERSPNIACSTNEASPTRYPAWRRPAICCRTSTTSGSRSSESVFGSYPCSHWRRSARTSPNEASSLRPWRLGSRWWPVNRCGRARAGIVKALAHGKAVEALRQDRMLRGLVNDDLGLEPSADMRSLVAPLEFGSRCPDRPP
jgi:hypothetical protein